MQRVRNHTETKVILVVPQVEKAVDKLFKKDILCPELAKSVTLEDAKNVYLVPID